MDSIKFTNKPAKIVGAPPHSGSPILQPVFQQDNFIKGEIISSSVRQVSREPEIKISGEIVNNFIGMPLVGTQATSSAMLPPLDSGNQTVSNVGIKKGSKKLRPIPGAKQTSFFENIIERISTWFKNLMGIED
jgi:hypothetical protein